MKYDYHTYYGNINLDIHNIKRKKYVVYVHPNSDENSAERWGTQPTTSVSYKVVSTGSSIKPEAPHFVVVSLFVRIIKDVAWSKLLRSCKKNSS